MIYQVKELMALSDQLFSQVAVVSDRAPMKAYMKGHFDFYGVKSPARKVVLKEMKVGVKEMEPELVFYFVEELWRHNKRESQYLALDLLEFKKKVWTPEYLPRIERLITTKSWWDTVDGLAPNIAGQIFKNDFDVKIKWIQKWNSSDNMWLNRSALIHQLRYKSEVDLSLLFALAESHIGSKEFFINKASGWALRQASKYYPEEVAEFIDNHPELSNLTKREGKKYL